MTVRTLPLEVFEEAVINPDKVLKCSDMLSILVGEKVEKPEDFLNALRKIRRLRGRRSIDYGEYSDTVYFYKDIDPRAYFRHPVLAAMRGSIVRVYENNEVRQVAFPFAKFFNLGETEATSNPPGLGGGFTVTEKLDGTLIIAWIDPDTGELRYSTRGMLDMHKPVRGRGGRYYVEATLGRVSNPYVVRFVNAIRRYGLLYELESVVAEDRTVMFELVYKIPGSYSFDIDDTPEDSPDWRPYLLAYRRHDDASIVYPRDTGFPAPTVYNVKSLRDVLEIVEASDDREGLVLHYPGLSYHPSLPWWNYMIKVKNRTYVMKAYIRGGDVPPRRLAELVIIGRSDDVVSLLDRDKARFIREYSERYERVREAWSGFLDTVYSIYRERGEKVFRALENNLSMRHMVPYLEKVIQVAERTGDYEAAGDRSLRELALKYLVYKGGEKALLRALDRFAARLEKAAAALREIFRS